MNNTEIVRPANCKAPQDIYTQCPEDRICDNCKYNSARSGTQTERKHAPLPCSYDPEYKVLCDDNGNVIADMDPSCDMTQWASLIVRACNSHYRLVEALKNAWSSLCVLSLPQLDNNVATNEDIIRATIKGIRAALADVE